MHNLSTNQYLSPGFQKLGDIEKFSFIPAKISQDTKIVYLPVLNSSLRPFKTTKLMDNLHHRLTPDLGRKNDPKISRIAKFDGEMLKILKI